MIRTICNNKKLKLYLRHKIEDAGIEVAVEETLQENEYVGIKVDEYYAAQRMGGETPKSVDYIVAVDCRMNWYALYILEFKNVKSPRQYTAHEIQDKFTTAVDRFLKQDWKEIFECDQYKYKDIKLYLVTNAYKRAMKYGSYGKYAQMMKKINSKDTLMRDTELSQKIYTFRGKRLKIEREIPPNPVIRRIL